MALVGIISLMVHTHVPFDADAPLPVPTRPAQPMSRRGYGHEVMSASAKDPTTSRNRNVGVVERRVTVDASADDCFVVASSYGVRLEWDPFVRAQHLMNAGRAAPGVRTWTRSRHGLVMVSEYVTYRRPTLMGMKMVTGPALFRTFSGSWHFAATDGHRCEVTFRYRFDCRPTWLQWLTHPVGRWYLGRDIERRLAAFAHGVEDADIVARARAELEDFEGAADSS